MKTIIAGSRRIGRKTDKELVVLVADAVMASGFGPDITEVVSGGARGIDKAGENWAANNVFGPLPVKQFIPDWDKEGKRAGLLRNIEMANYANALIAVWDGQSRGTAHMIAQAEKRGLRVFVYRVKA